MGFLSPKDKGYIKLYAKQIQILFDSSNLLVKMAESEPEKYTEIASQMRELEKQSQIAKLDSVKWINDSFITPYDRIDMYILSSRIDDIVDEYDKAIDIIHLFQIENMSKKMTKEVNILQKLAKNLLDLTPNLSDLKKQTNLFIEMRENVVAVEKAHRNLLAKLFKDSQNAKEIIKIKSLIDGLNGICATFEDTISNLESIAIKE